MTRKVLTALGVITFLVVLASVVFGVTASYNMTVRIVDSSGNVINGVASATTALYNQTVRVVDSNGNVIDSFGAPTGTPTPTPTLTPTPTQTPTPTPTPTATPTPGALSMVGNVQSDNAGAFGTAGYFPLSGGVASIGANEASVQFPLSSVYTVKNLQCKRRTSPGGGGVGNTITYVIMDNGTPTALTCAIQAPATTCSDPTDAITTTAGHLYDIRILASPGATPTSTPAATQAGCSVGP